jgi:uncharacterized membrane protein
MVFAAKCAGCHGPDLAKPRGRFGYVLDLAKVASNPEMVVPFRPDESELWQLVRNNEMPPADSPRGPLSESEKEVIRGWIAAGAPDAPLRETTIPESIGEVEEAEVGSSRAGSVLRMLGRFHLLLLHFPIALTAAAALGALWSVWQCDNQPSSAVRYCLWLAAVATVPTVALGWLHAASGNGAGSPELLNWHRWLGTAAGACIVASAVLFEIDVRRSKRSWPTQIVLPIAVLLVAVAAHFGGLLVHGSEFYFR